VTIAIGLWAAQRVHDSRDYIVRRQPAAVHEHRHGVRHLVRRRSVLSVSVEFLKERAERNRRDPFGSSIVPVIVALLFARAFYRMDPAHDRRLLRKLRPQHELGPRGDRDLRISAGPRRS